MSDSAKQPHTQDFQTAPLHGILDQFPLGIALLDGHGTVAYLNQACLDLLTAGNHPSKGDISGAHLTEFPCFEHPTAHSAIVDPLLQNTPVDLRWPPEGSSIPDCEGVWRVRGLPMDLAHNNGVAAVLLVEDVTDTDRMRRHLGQAQRMESVGSLASAVAHDFNNILTAILGSVYLLKHEIGDQDTLREPLETIEHTALSAGELAEKLLTLSRSRTLEETELSVSAVVRESQTILTRVLSEGIQLRLDLTDEDWSVRSDPSQILHTLVNLCLNAQHAMNGRGIITISTHNADRTRLPMFEAGLEPGHYVVISVTDQGPGIPTELMDRVFDPFFTTKEGGTGLGLSTTYSYACEQGGTVTLYSEPDKGTTVKVYLREDPKSPVHPVERARHPEGDLTGSETLLLVDDEPILLELGKEILALNGYTVITALSGEEALQAQVTSKEPIPLAILDLAMPGINGLETLRRLRDRNPAIKAILSSGFHPSPKMESLLASEVDAFINKPYEIDALAREVRRLLDG